MKFNWRIGWLLMVFGCVNAKNEALYNLNLQTFECMGNCPVYEVKIDSLRNLSFKGYKNVKSAHYEGKISRSEYASLVQMMDEVMLDGPSSLEVGSVDDSNKEIVITKRDSRKILKVQKENPQMIKLDSMVHRILSVRGLLD